MGVNFDWTPEAVEKLTQLWADGLSGDQIARAFGYVITRQSAIGKAHRLKLAQRAPEMNRHLSGSRMFRKPVGTKPKIVPMPAIIALDEKPPEPLTDESGNPITALNAHDCHCRYVYGEVSDGSYRYCGAQVDRGSFCSAHRKICYTPATIHRRAEP